MSERNRHDKAMQLIAEGEGDDAIRILTGYQPETIRMLRCETIHRQPSTSERKSEPNGLGLQEGLF